ncbi:MAG TPA: YhfC family glutamic-type intramembrane protease [Anaerolineales bacterium]|nr:YhfC family intramembrane metalloprotease [Anaerolineales bacterium]HMS01203.1 YhfC family glutamic-type intramembrane protease [Anaerolineales bacterium]HNQ95898.1 YhfC family glutamic-type intramembrane protease [Anaerolineales bacterium]HNS61853.1 YhfC family glutamic-type intramembrane protease [Anaerolineales bacterium]
MLTAAYVVSFTGMILLPILLWIIFTRKYSLSWKLVLAGGLTFIASQILHIPLVLGLNKFLQNASLLVTAIVLGLLAGVFEETARYILFKFILKRSRSWKEGVLVGLGHGGIEAMLIGISAVATLVFMMSYRSIDLSTVPSIPPEQLDLAKQQVDAFWSTQPYMALLGFFERVFAMCLHVSLSLIVLYGLAKKQAVWFWLALLWHTFVDAVAVYASKSVGVLQTEGLVAIFALISLWIVFKMRPKFEQINQAGEPEAVAG